MEQSPEQTNPAEDTSNTSDMLVKAREYAHELQHNNPVSQYYKKNPYVVLIGAAGVGYLAGRGAFTPFTRRIVKMGMRAVLVPVIASQIKSFVQPQPPK